MHKLKKDDTVVVIAGKDKGKQGKILRIFAAKGRVLVEGINLVKKHVKQNPQKGVAGGIVSREASIHHSNVAIFNHVTKKADRVGIKVLKDGRKVRYFKSNDELLDI